MPPTRRPEEYEIPASWPLKDMSEWIKMTLEEPGVRSVEVVKRGQKYWFLVNFKPSS